MQIDSSAYAYVTYRITINLSMGFSLGMLDPMSCCSIVQARI
jgi:hypothetical protein